MNNDPPRDMNRPDKPGRPVPQLLVERLALGELPPERAAAVRRRLAEEPGGLSRLESLAADNRATLEALPPLSMAQTIDRRAAQQVEQAAPSDGWTWFRWGGPVAAFAALILILVVAPGQPNEHDPLVTNEPGAFLPGVSAERTKGDAKPFLVLVRKDADGGSSYLADGERATEGDLVQVGYMAANMRYGAIFSVDGLGTVTWHLPSEGPEQGAQAAPLKSDGEQWLTESYELDDAPAFERFYFVTSESPFDLGRLDRAARAHGGGLGPDGTATLDLMEGLTQVTLALTKPDPATRAEEARP